MKAKTDLDISLKPALMPSQFSTDGCSIDFGTFDKHGFIYVPSCIGEQCQPAPGTGDCAAATQASSLQESDSSGKIAPPGTFDKHGFIQVPSCIGEQCQSAPGTRGCAAAAQASSLQESDSSDKIAPPGEGKVQQTTITKDPGESVGDVIVDNLTKRMLDVDSPEIITGGFSRAKLMDNLRCLAENRKKRKTSG